MSPNFDELCVSLGLSTDTITPKSLTILEQWCHQFVSSDQVYLGSLEEQYSDYSLLAIQYLDFMSKKPQDINSALKVNGMSVIQFAAYKGYNHFLASLKVPKAVWNETNTEGFTPLHLAALQGYVHTVETLLAQGASHEQANNNKQLPVFSALFVVALYADNQEYLNRKEKIAHVLMQLKPDVLNHQDNEGTTVLHLMATNGFTNLVKELLGRKESIALATTADAAGVYPIHMAVLNQHLETVRLLLTIKGQAELKDSQGQVALHHAAQFGTLDMLRVCAEATSDINVRDGNEKTPLMLAAEAGKQTSVMYLIKERGADVTKASICF